MLKSALSVNFDLTQYINKYKKRLNCLFEVEIIREISFDSSFAKQVSLFLVVGLKRQCENTTAL